MTGLHNGKEKDYRRPAGSLGSRSAQEQPPLPAAETKPIADWSGHNKRPQRRSRGQVTEGGKCCPSPPGQHDRRLLSIYGLFAWIPCQDFGISCWSQCPPANIATGTSMRLAGSAYEKQEK